MNAILELKVADIIDEIPDVLILLDSNFRIIDVSNYFVIHSNLLKDDIIGSQLTELIHPEENSLVATEICDFTDSNKEVLNCTFRLKNSSSSFVCLKAAIKRVNWGNIDYILSATNISDLRTEILSKSAEVQKYKQLEKIAKIGIWELDIKSDSVSWSDEVYEIHKKDKKNAITLEEAIKFYHPDDRILISEAVRLCIDKGLPFHERLRIINTEGEQVWVVAIGKGILNSAGEVFKVYGTFQDITESVALEAEKNKSQLIAKSYQNIMDEFAIVAKTDKDGIITYVNDQLCTISEFSKEELIGQNHRILNSGYHSSEFWEQMWGTITSGKTWRGEVCNKTKSGGLYWVDTFISPLLNESQQIIGYMVVRVDVTSKKKAEEDLNLEKDRATISAQLAAVGEMSAGIAHEINNPLAVISSTLQLVDSKLSKGKEVDIPGRIKLIQRSVNRISKIIKGLKRLSYKSSSQEFESASVIEILNETLDFSSEMLKAKGIDLLIEDIPDCNINCRSVEISQVILNLVNNARDAILEAPKKWIKVQARIDSKKLFIEIIDSGEGIPKEIQDKIMESFFTTKAFGKGTGLGLSLSKRIIKEHGGELSFSTKDGHTCFSVMLPIA